MGHALDSVVNSAHEGIAEVRQGVASTEVALGVADEALNASDVLLVKADHGVDIAAEGIGKIGHFARLAVLGIGIAVAVGSGVMIARRRRAAQSAEDMWMPEAESDPANAE